MAEKEMTEKEAEEAIQAVYAYAAQLKGEGKKRSEIKVALTEEGLDEETADDVISNLNKYISAMKNQGSDDGGGVLGVLGFIGIFVVINILSYVFNWGYIIY